MSTPRKTIVELQTDAMNYSRRSAEIRNAISQRNCITILKKCPNVAADVRVLEPEWFADRTRFGWTDAQRAERARGTMQSDDDDDDGRNTSVGGEGKKIRVPSPRCTMQHDDDVGANMSVDGEG